MHLSIILVMYEIFVDCSRAVITIPISWGYGIAGIYIVLPEPVRYNCFKAEVFRKKIWNVTVADYLRKKNSS